MEMQWERFAADFNAMTDEQIAETEREARDEIDRHEEWLEAVESWVRAGKPRNH